MGWKIWQECREKQMVTQAFYVLAVTLLSLLLPLSFLLLARLATANYLLSFTPFQPPQPQPFSLLLSLFLSTSPTLLHLLVSLVSVAALVHGLTGRITFNINITSDDHDHFHQSIPIPIFRPRLYTAWISLCTLQVCVGVGIEGSIAAGFDWSGLSFGRERSLLSRLIFFLGLHETMLHWSRMVVKPVVDDTVLGFAREERWVERVGIAAGFALLWWWRLRDEVESLVAVAEVKREVLMGVGVADFIGWWLYYLTVTIGTVRVVKSLMWVGMKLACRRFEEQSTDSANYSHSNNEDKV